mgnify:CR=1 FL=1
MDGQGQLAIDSARKVAAKVTDQALKELPLLAGFRVVPSMIEFWYGARHRLHERWRHELVDGIWQERMLYP